MKPYPETLGAKPRIKSPEDVETALAEFAWCRSLREKSEAELDAEIQRLRDENKAAQLLEIENGTTVSLAEREALLEAAIAKFVKAHPDAGKTDSKKSRKYRHGTVGFRTTAAKIAWQDGQDSKKVLASLEKTWNLVEKIAGWVKRLKLPFGKDRQISAKHFLDVKPSISLSLVKSSYKDGQLKDADLKRLGMQKVPESEEIYVTPAKHAPDPVAAS